MNSYKYIYLITNVFATYTILRFMYVFFDEKITKRKYEALSYLAYFAMISYSYLVIKIPVIILLANILGVFFLTYNYKGTLKKRIVSTLYIYVILMFVESFVVVITSQVNFSLFSNTEYASIVGLIMIKIFSYIVVLIAKNYKSIKIGIKIPTSYWISLFIIPLGTLYITLIIFESGIIKGFYLVSCIFIMFAINITAFYLYDVLNNSYTDKIEKTLLKQENTYYHKQFELMNDSYNNMRSMRHDIKNHLLILNSLINKDKRENALNYINDMVNNSYNVHELISTGNIDIDSIINCKFQNVKENNINLKTDIKVPEELNITTHDIVVILANLIDNALHAVQKLISNKKIILDISYKKGVLYIHIENTYDRVVTYKDNKIITSEEDKENHGFGLTNIEKVVNKYNGLMKIYNTDTIFSVDILLYLIY